MSTRASTPGLAGLQARLFQAGGNAPGGARTARRYSTGKLAFYRVFCRIAPRRSGRMQFCEDRACGGAWTVWLFNWYPCLPRGFSPTPNCGVCSAPEEDIDLSTSVASHRMCARSGERSARPPVANHTGAQLPAANHYTPAKFQHALNLVAERAYHPRARSTSRSFFTAQAIRGSEGLALGRDKVHEEVESLYRRRPEIAWLACKWRQTDGPLHSCGATPAQSVPSGKTPGACRHRRQVPAQRYSDQRREPSSLPSVN